MRVDMVVVLVVRLAGQYLPITRYGLHSRPPPPLADDVGRRGASGRCWLEMHTYYTQLASQPVGGFAANAVVTGPTRRICDAPAGRTVLCLIV